MAGNHIGAWQGNGTLNIGPWQGVATVSPPIIITHPASQVIEAGQVVTFIVVASGTAPLSYQWYKNGILQVGETTPTYDFTTSLSNDGDTIYVIVSNVAGSVTSNTATLEVYETIPISNLDYYTREQPTKSEELVNRVVVTTQPLVAATATEEIFKMSEAFSLTPTESKDFTIYYKKIPVLETGTITTFVDTTGGVFTLTSATYYPWGAELTVTNNDVTTGEARVKIEGFPIEVSGEESIVEEALPEIKTYGLQEYIYPKNHLIQGSTIAGLIASNLLASYKTIRKDTSIVWRGNPALELGDVIEVPEYKRGATNVTGNFKIVKNQIEYDGTLREKTDARKV